MIVLGYIKNVSRHFKTFVGNRLSVIHSATSPDQWCYIKSNLNPADIASRGIDESDTEKLRVWLNGPEFIWHDSLHWPQQNLTCNIPDDDVEIKKEVVINNTTASYFIDSFADHYSDWRKLQRATAWLTRFKVYCRHLYLRHPERCQRGNLTLTEIQKVNSYQISCVGRFIIFSLLESWYVASKPVCGLTSYKLRSSVLTSSLKLSVLCERLGIRIVIFGLLIVNHGFRFR